MEIINELLSDNIGYLNALRNAEVLPRNTTASENIDKQLYFKLSNLVVFIMLVGGISLTLFICLDNEKSRERK